MHMWIRIIALLTLALWPLAAQDEADEPPRFIRGQSTLPPEEGLADGLIQGERATESSRSRRQLHVEVDEGTRTVFITTDPNTNIHVQDIIRALDQPVPQALIKVLFLEVTHNDDLDVGIDARYTRTEPDGDRSIISSLFGVASETRGGIVNLLHGDLEVTIRALAEVGKLNVLSRPSILTRNNQEATITIGQEVPFIRNSRITQDGQIINTVEYEDIGIILTVTPHIGADGLIELDVYPEISTLTGVTVPISENVNAPVFAKRSAATRVVVPSGKTVVIGGLMEDQETRNVRSVPILGSIPWVGGLFRRTIIRKQKTELLIFLTPTVVANGQELVRISGHERDRMEMIGRDKERARLEHYLEPEVSLEPLN